jgi:hypothetical protein
LLLRQNCRQLCCCGKFAGSFAQGFSILLLIFSKYAAGLSAAWHYWTELNCRLENFMHTQQNLQFGSFLSLTKQGFRIWVNNYGK